MASIVEDGEYWYQGAEEMRAVAAEITDPDVKHRMLEIAEGYAKLARRAELRAIQADNRNR